MARSVGLRRRDGIAGAALVYLMWTFLRGAWVHEYPYPFIDVGQLGWAAVFRNAVGVLAAFLALGAVLIAIDRLLGRVRAL